MSGLLARNTQTQRRRSPIYMLPTRKTEKKAHFRAKDT